MRSTRVLAELPSQNPLQPRIELPRAGTAQPIHLSDTRTDRALNHVLGIDVASARMVLRKPLPNETVQCPTESLLVGEELEQLIPRLTIPGLRPPNQLRQGIVVHREQWAAEHLRRPCAWRALTSRYRCHHPSRRATILSETRSIVRSEVSRRNGEAPGRSTSHLPAVGHSASSAQLQPRRPDPEPRRPSPPVDARTEFGVLSGPDPSRHSADRSGPRPGLSERLTQPRKVRSSPRRTQKTRQVTEPASRIPHALYERRPAPYTQKKRIEQCTYPDT